MNQPNSTPARNPGHRDQSRPARQRSARVPNSLDVARRAFAALVSDPAPLGLDGADFAGLPLRWLTLREVRDLLLESTCPHATRDQVWSYLVTSSRERGEPWTVGAVGVALPALTSVAARLTARFAGDPSDIHSEVLAGFLAALPMVDVSRPRIMVRLRWAAYRAGHAALTAALTAPPPTAPDLSDDSASSVASPMAGHPDLVLARAVADGVLTRDEAALIGLTRLENATVTEWARAHAQSSWAVYKQRRRAELRLAAYLLDADSTPMPVAALTMAAGRSEITHRDRLLEPRPDSARSARDTA